MSDELTPHSRVEQLLDALLNGGEGPEPLSRIEKLLSALLKGEVPAVSPLSRVEAYLLALCEKGMGGGTAINNQDKTITANGEYTADTGYTGLGKVTVNVADSGTSGSGVAPGDVTFRDYDGTVLYSYTLEETQALTELPALPSHDGLVCQGWNWTLDAIKALNRPVTVGAAYVTDDGATRLHIRIATTGRMTVPLYFGQTVENGVSIDWGDGSAAETLPSTGYVNTSHTYAQPGDYVISLLPEDGCTLSLGSSSNCVLGLNSNTAKVYTNMLQAVHIGKGVTSIGSSAFQNCYSLASITIPDGVTSIGNNAFRYCYSLASVTIPNGVTSIGYYAFYSCYSLASITIPNGVTSISNDTFGCCRSLTSITIPDSVTSIDYNAFQNCNTLASVTIPNGVTSISDKAFYGCNSLASITIPNGVTSIGSSAFYGCDTLASVTIPNGVTSIGDNAFYSCYSLASITIPDGVTSISDYAFRYCYVMRYYDFSGCTSVPALSNTNAFSNIPSDCEMLIPAALYDEWSAATNWATYASYMVAV